MNKLLLITSKLFQYRIEVYNYFNIRLREQGIELFVIANSIQENNTQSILFKFELLDFKDYLKKIRLYKPNIIVIFLNLSDIIIWPLIFFIKQKKIPFIYWSHGLNLQDPNNKIKNNFYYFIHQKADSILLYTPDQLKYIRVKNRNKVFIANNTLNFNSFPVIKETRAELRIKYHINFPKIVLYVGRILPYKRLDILLDIFDDIKNIDKEIGLIIIGAGITSKLTEKINKMNNVKYLGAIYNHNIVNEYFKLSDIFCIPGANGLSVNQAMYWGLPCLTLNVLQGPEVWYIKQGETGFILNDKDELKAKILQILNDRDQLEKLSRNAYQIMRTDGRIDKMFEGFYNAIQYVKK